jgi:hypothetical protein
MKRRLIFLTVLSLALMATGGVMAAPQSRGSATLTGVVIGPDDKPAVHADAHGRFTISQLRGDNYDIRASAKGIFSEWEKNIPLRKGQTRSMELRLIYAKEMPKSASKTKPKQ